MERQSTMTSTYVVDHSAKRQSMHRSTVDLLVLILICHKDYIPAQSRHGEQASERFGLYIGKPSQRSRAGEASPFRNPGAASRHLDSRSKGR